MALSVGERDCLRAGDTCSSDDTCSPRLRTLRQCVAGDGSVKLGPGARNQCENAMTALLSTPLHGCQCKRGMKKEKNCLSIYWSLHQSVLHGKTGSNTQNLMVLVPGGGREQVQYVIEIIKCVLPITHKLDVNRKFQAGNAKSDYFVKNSSN